MNKEERRSKAADGEDDQTHPPMCPKNYKPWIIALVVMALLTIAWALAEKYKLKPGDIPHLFSRIGKGALNGDNGDNGDNGEPGTSSQTTLAAGIPEPVRGIQNSYHAVVDIVRPAVVHIRAISNAPGLQIQARQPLDPQAGENIPVFMSVGSGVIIDPRGFTLSNYHVIRGATDLKATVYTPAGEKEYDVKVVKEDRETDLVVLRIIGDSAFPYAILGDSDRVRTGDVVLALGSPFGFEQTVTSGIISSRNRNISVNGMSYRNIIQTDAPINRGNSGGPLVNMRGEIVGINMAIYTPTGSFTGISFAVPVNQTAGVLAGIVDFAGTAPQAAGGLLASMGSSGHQSGNSYRFKGGEVIVPPHQYRGRCIECHPQLQSEEIPGISSQAEQGMITAGHNIRLINGRLRIQNVAWLGAGVIEVDDIVAEQFGLIHAGGVLVNNVVHGGPADSGGLKRGDVIIRIGGKKVPDMNALATVMNGRAIGDNTEVVVLRNNTRERLIIAAGRRPAPGMIPVMPGPKGPKEFEWLGCEFTGLDPALKIYEDGVRVADAGGLLAASGLAKGDIIKSINGIPVTDLPSLMAAARDININKGLLLDIKRAGNPLYIVVR